MTIRLWPEAERPRERLLRQGSEALSDAELLAIFLRTGCAGISAVDLARDTLSKFGNLRCLFEASETEFCQAKGLGRAKFVQLQAVLELSRRYLAESLQKEKQLNSSTAVKTFLISKLRHRESEVFAALFLDTQHQLIEYRELFQGTIDGASVYPREVVKTALSINSAAIIFAHNHPSGVSEPSQADRTITARLSKALSLVDIRTLDHIVVGEHDCVSFAERAWI